MGWVEGIISLWNPVIYDALYPARPNKKFYSTEALNCLLEYR